jgi:hypothetical protein
MTRAGKISRRQKEGDILGSVLRVVVLSVLAAWLGGCEDRAVDLRYTPNPAIERLPRAEAVTVCRFTDVRGVEGDHGDPFRVGGIYNGYGMRYAKIMTPDPWPDTLIQDLVAGFTQRGVSAVGAPDRMYVERAMVATPLALTGEIHNFSTEARWLGLMAHVSGIVRLFDQAGTPLVTKPVSARVRWLPDVKLPPDQPVLEGLLNVAIDEFVTKVVADPEVTQYLLAVRR